MGSGTRFLRRGRWPLAAAAAVVLSVTATALAGSGVGDVFNLRVTNNVDASSLLRGASRQAVLDVQNNDPRSSADAGIRRAADATPPALVRPNPAGRAR